MTNLINTCALSCTYKFRGQLCCAPCLGILGHDEDHYDGEHTWKKSVRDVD